MKKKKTSQTDTNPQNPPKMQVVRCGDWQDPGPAAVFSSSPESACDNRPVSGRQGSIFYPIRGGSDMCHQRWVSNVWKRAQATIRTPHPHPTPTPGLIQSPFWAPSPLLAPVLSSCLKIKTVYKNASSTAFFFFFFLIIPVFKADW